MRKIINTTHLAGFLYQHNLTMKVTGEKSKNPGTEFISGSIEVATDDACTNVVPVYFTYVTAATKNGKENATYTALKNMINGVTKTVMGHGKDQAAKVRVDSAIGLNEFYTDRNGKEELVSAKRNEGGFVHVVTSVEDAPNERSTFACDMIITNVTVKEADLERNMPEKAILKGTIFDFRNALLPVEFSVVDPAGIAYFESLGASPKEPVFTKVWGQQISETVTRTVTEESAFGGASVREIKSSRKDFVVDHAAPSPYVWDDESTITVKELTELMAARETYLATVKQRQEEYKASKNAPVATTAPTAVGGFNF